MASKKQLIKARPSIPGDSEIRTVDAGSPHQSNSLKTLENPYYSLFQYSPVSIWREDFSGVKSCFDNLRKKGIHDFRTYFETHPEAVLSLAQKVKINEVNDATLRMYRAETQKALREGLSNIFSKDSYDVFREELIALSEGKSEFFSEAVNLTLTGEELHILIKVVVPPGNKKTLSNVFVYIIDISVIKQMENDLRESEEKYRTIVETAHDAILVADVDTGIILEANKQAEILVRRPVDEIVGMHFTELHPKEETARYRKFFEQHVQSGRYVSENLVLCDYRGERIPVSVSSSVVYLHGKKCISGIFREVTPLAQRGETEIAEKYHHDLSPRECEILKLITSGLSTKEIAEQLYISEKTVQTHRARVMEKLGIHKIADLVRYAVNTGLLDKTPPG